MAELAVSAALGLAEIVSPLLNKLNVKEDVKDDIKGMKSWLTSMKAFLEDNDGRPVSRTLEDQVEKVRSIAYDIEDVLEECVLHSPLYLFHDRKIIRKARNFAHHVKHGLPLFGISEKIASIKRDIENIRSQREVFPENSHSGARPSSSSNFSIPHQASPLLLDREMIGYENPKKEFIRLMEDGERKLVKLAVVGPGGSGKTTFAKNVFWKKKIRGQFDCHAWVHVGWHFDVQNIFVNLLKQFSSSRKDPYSIDDSLNLPSRLRNYLAGKRYVVVLDDIWSKIHWEHIKDALPDASPGCRIIVTTRSSDVASVFASTRQHIFTIDGLEWLQGWKLFCREAFPESDGECSSELKDCAVRIVKRCEGLPLAIVAVGGALAHKPRLPYEWDRFHDNLECETWNDPDLYVIRNALLPGYMDLSSNLKSCFLYFSMFPEDYSVERGRLIRLWVAEGFALGTDYKTAEEVADDYLNQLIHKNLVHVSNWDFDGRPRNCRVLNIVHKLIIQKSKDENFASIFYKENTSPSKKIRRLSVHDDCNQLPPGSDCRGVCSMFLFSLWQMSPSDFEKHLRRLKLLRVLDFQAGLISTEFPKGVTDLSLIRYLSLRGSKIKMIPSSIKKLSYLETLDLKQTDVKELPKEISHLHNLCHLFAYKYNVDNYVVFDSVQGVKVSDGFSKLKKLQDLSLVKVDKKGKILKELKELSQLRKLGLMGLKWEHGKDLSASVEKMQKLRTLDVCTSSKEEYLELGEMTNPPQSLQRLYLKGRLRELPAWISSLNNLLRIGLKWSRMNCSPLNGLECLPNLMELQLVDCYLGQELIFRASRFRKLNILLIEEFSELRTIEIEDGAMPNLKQLSLRRCPRLTMLPRGLENLVKVEELALHDMAEELVSRLGKNGEDHVMVSNIPVINYFTLNSQSGSFQNLSGAISR